FTHCGGNRTLAGGGALLGCLAVRNHVVAENAHSSHERTQR
ncbi:galactose-1-phosphate uridylyltransferase, partial [Vibrio parahaemolyticus V-223/04]